MSDITLHTADGDAYTVESEGVAIGDWYWLYDGELDGELDGEDYSQNFTKLDYKTMFCPEGYNILTCVEHIGSNYVLLRHPTYKHSRNGTSSYSTRVHYNNFFKIAMKCNNPDEIIRKNREYYEAKHAHLLGHVNDTLSRIGAGPKPKASGGSSSDNALVVMSEQPDIQAHKNALVTIKDEFLPEKMQEIKAVTAHMAKWMQAPMLTIGTVYKDANKAIDKQLFSISLYAGFDESSHQIIEGDPAPENEKLHVFQRMLYMDEECLLDYDDGGFEFRNLHEFYKWISRPVNFNRIFPFQKTMVAFRVRRKIKDRYSDSPLSAWVNFRLEQTDMYTYMFIRNGEQLHVVASEIEFDEKIIPDENSMYFGADLLFNLRAKQKFMRREEWEALDAEYKENKRIADQWEIDNPEDENDTQAWSSTGYRWGNPHRNLTTSWASEYISLNDDSVYFDDALKVLYAQAEKQNKIALVIQGIIDRSTMLHPFPKVRLWNHEELNSSLVLIHDSNALYNGDEPDIEAYFKNLRDQITKGSIVGGQLSAHYDKVAKSNRHSTYADPGPVDPAPITEWMPRARKATFRWERGRVSNYDDVYYGRKSATVPAHVTVHADDLLNYSAYKLGDYRKFFQDPRTREKYLLWAKPLLTMEKWHREQAKGIDPDCDACGEGAMIPYGSRMKRGDGPWQQEARCNSCQHRTTIKVYDKDGEEFPL